MLAQKIFLLLLAVDPSKEFLNFNFAGKLHDTVYHSLGARRATRNKHVDRHNILDALGHVIGFTERTARRWRTSRMLSHI